MKKLILLFIALSLVILSCTTEQKILEGMLMSNLPKAKCEKSFCSNDTLRRINVISSHIFGIDTFPKVNKLRGLFVPLLFVNIWNFQFDAKLGLRNFIKELDSNIRDNIYDFLSRDSVINPNTFVKIEVSVDSIKSKIPFVNKGVFLFALLSYAMIYRDYAGPGEVELTLGYKINAGNSIKTGTITKAARISILKNSKFVFRNFVIDYTSYVLQALNITIREACLEICKEAGKQ